MRPKTVTGGLVGLMLLASSVPASLAGVDDGQPHLSLRRTNPSVLEEKYGDRAVSVELPVYVQAQEAPLDLRIRRASYTDPLVLFQVKHTSTGEEWVDLGSDLNDGWEGLREFSRVRIRDAENNLVFAETRRFCPNDWDRQRIDDSGPTNPVFPDECYGRNRSFLKGMGWGIDVGWAAPVTRSVRLDVEPGEYHGSVRIREAYRDLFGIAAPDAVAKFSITIVEGDSDGEFHPLRTRREEGSRPKASLESAGAGASPLPDLQALPAFHIDMENRGGGSRIEFAANVWNEGPSPLVVEGFRRPDEDVMDAYQYFYEDGEQVGEGEPVGTFEYDRRDGHFHWHFLQFARYRLVNIDTGQIVRSSKQSFCVVPTDGIDLSLGPASWNTEAGDLRTSCGGANALWIREVLPVGWGDTYSQVAGQAFHVGNVPNGRYWLQVEANPKGLLHEEDMTNNVARRKVILKGEAGNRKIAVRNWQGVDW